jgi:predicted aspartyl protease
MKIMCKGNNKINDVNAKSPRQHIQINSIKGMEHKWLFDTGAALTCMSSRAFRKISKENRPLKINAIGKTAQGASGSTLIPDRIYMIPME